LNTACVCSGALCFFNKVALLLIKKYMLLGAILKPNIVDK